MSDDAIHLPLTEVRVKLGFSYPVWVALLSLRGDDGATAATVEDMAEESMVDVRMVRKALERLTAAGLVIGTGYKGGGPGVVRRVRQVFGGIDGEVATLPVESAGWVKAAPAHGGNRPGAGRLGKETGRWLGIKKGGSELIKRVSSALINRGGSLSEAGEEASTAPLAGPSIPNLKKNQEGLSTESHDLSRGGEIQERSARSYIPPGYTLSPAPTARSVNSEGRTGGLLTAGLGSCLPGGSGRPLNLSRLAERGLIPPFPDLRTLPGVLIPDPPRLDPNEPAKMRVQTVATAMREALRGRRVKGGSPIFRRDLDERTRRLVGEAASAFIANEIPPASWCAWSIDVWNRAKAEGSRLEAPPLNFVFGANRIHERAGWFWSESRGYMGGRLLSAPTRDKVLAAYSKMRRALHASGSEDPEIVRAIVAKHFPRGFAASVAAARREIDAQREELKTAIEQGVYVW